jgi:NAD(P)-dependent dehydrogenase (short-subunit alcohol dehydrogenase family)
MAKRFDDAAVWITGGGSGIGKALALEMARQGARVAVSGRREDRLRAVVEALEASGRPALAVPCDVTEEAQVAAAADRVAEAFGGLDVAVANAGFSVGGPVETLTAEEWRRQLDVNVVGAALTAKHALPYLRERRGRLALVGSVAAFLGLGRSAAYCASKAALRALGQSLSVELAGSGVTCTTLHPGFVESEIGQVDNAGVYRPEREDRRPRNLMWSAEDAARVMARAIHGRAQEQVFTGHGRAAAFFAQHFPRVSVALQARAGARRRRRRPRR